MSTIKYQIFISSTYTDLHTERDEVIKAILEMGHIPVGMEMFSAADEEQWKLISRQIDQSDYYIVIVAHRYGSVAGRKSYTEKEYDYAIQQGVPILGFIIEDSAPWPSDRMESDSRKVKALSLFKEKIKRKPVGFWSSADELHGKVSIALMKLINTNPRPGWVRSSEVVGPEVVSEMSRLSSENAQLRMQLEEFRSADTSHFAQGEDKFDLEFTYYDSITGRADSSMSISWNHLFLVIGKTSLQDPAESKIKEAIEEVIPSHLKSIGKAQSQRYLVLREGELLKIKTQFVALGYFEIQVTARPRSSGNDYMHPHWILTNIGRKKLVELSAIRRN